MTGNERSPLVADEDSPLLSRQDSKDGVADNVVDFNLDGDSENPMDWSDGYKWSIVALLAFMAFTVTFTCISVVPIASRIVEDLDEHHRPNKEASVLLVTIWELGEAAGPLLIGPLSELFGRHVVINVANALFIATTILGACSQSISLLIAARILTGLVVAPNVLGPAIVGDIFQPEQRGTAMSLIMLAPLIGGAIGPAIAGAIAENMGWRQVLWIAAALATACEAAFLCCFRETYKVVILRKKAARLRKETGNTDLKTVFDIEGESSLTKVWISITRPFSVFFGSAVLQSMSLFGGMTFTYFYILSTSLPDILEGIYGLSPALTGSCFISASVGSVAAVALCNHTLDRIYISLRNSNDGVGKPEHRLPLVILGAITLPLVMVAYGWIAEYHLPLPVLLVTVALLDATLLLGYLPLSAYIVDAVGLYSASGMTAAIVTRCLMGTFFPLTTAPLVREFGFSFAFTILGGISLALAPIPILIYRYGGKWRGLSKYTRDS